MDNIIPEIVEFPVFPDARQTLFEYRGEGKVLEHHASWETEEMVPEVMDWYLNALSDGAWEIEKFPVDSQDAQTQYVIAREDAWRAFLTVEYSDDGNITLIIVYINYSPRN
jgi:hypothetical protein